MTLVKVNQRHYPKGDISRRVMALAIDFFGAWLLSSIVRTNQMGIQFAQIFVFIFAWIIFRVVIVYNNQGQSLGRWAFDLKILEVANGEIVNFRHYCSERVLFASLAYYYPFSWGISSSILRL
jgi:hypothetical protein